MAGEASAAPSDVAQALAVGPCLSFAVLGGFLTSAGCNVISYSQQHCPRRASHCCCKSLLYTANVALNLGSIACFLAGASFGPVAVVMPILTASKLLSSMIFQYFVGLASYSKDKQVGTLVLVLSALCLIEVGPVDPLGKQDVFALFSSTLALLWLVAMCALLVSSLVALHRLQASNLEEETEELREMVLLSAVVAVSTALGASIGKMLSITSDFVLAFCVVCYLGCGVLSFLFSAQAAFVCDMSVFLPVSECLQLLVNCSAGLCVWGDGGRIRGKLSYLMVYLLICLGVYLCSSLDLLAGTATNPEHEVVGRFSRLVRRSTTMKTGAQPMKIGAQPKFKQLRGIVKDAFDARDINGICNRLRREIRRSFELRLLTQEDASLLAHHLDRAASATREAAAELGEFADSHSSLIHFHSTGLAGATQSEPRFADLPWRAERTPSGVD